MGHNSRKRLVSQLVCFVLVLVLALVPRSVRADDTADEADLQFQLGAERYEAGDFRSALGHFLASNRLVPNRNVLFNVARTYEQLRRAPDAYRYYLLALEGETNPTARKRVEDALVRITPSVAILKIETDPPGATVYLDRTDLGPRGTTPRTLGLAEGKRKVIVEKPGYEAAESAQVQLKIGAEVVVTLKLRQMLGVAKLDGETGAQVKVDDENSPSVCTIPCETPVTPGRHTFFIVKEGFQNGEVTADIAANAVTPVRARLASQTGAVVVSADIRDALVTVDDQPVGFTPAVLKVPVGAHTLKVSQQGYRTFTQAIVVSTKTETKVDAELRVVEEVSAASRVTESVEDAPASVSIISQQELRAMGYPTIAEAVRGIRGLYLSDDRSYQSIGVRGFSRPGDYGNRVLILLDGHPMNDNYAFSSYVGTDGRASLDDVERIEIVRGPGSVLYGSSAFFGVINLVTKSRNEPTHGEASLSTFDNSIGRARATGVVRFSPEAGFWSSATMLQGFGQDYYFEEYDGTPNSIDAKGRTSNGITRGNDRQVGGMLTGRFWYKSFTLQWFLNSRKKIVPTGAYESTFGSQRASNADTRGLIEARFEPQLTKSLQSLSRAHVNLYNYDGFFPYTPDAEGPTRDSYRGRWGGLEQRFVFSPSEKLRLTAGGEFIRHFETKQVGVNDAGAYLIDNNGAAGRNDPFTIGAGYINADVVPTARLKVVAGARLDYYSNLPKFELLPAFNPRLAVIVKPWEGGNVKVMGAKAFRTPSVLELFYQSPLQLRPTKLSPEQIYSGEIEVTQRISQTVSATVAGYTNLVTDLVVLNDLGGGLIQYANAPSNVLVIGGEAEVRREWRQGWMVGATYSYQNARYTGGNGLRDLPNSLEHLASARGAAPLIGRSLVLMSRLSIEGPRPDKNENATDPPQDKTTTGVIWDVVFSGEAERLPIRYNLGLYNAMGWQYSIIPSGEVRQRQMVQNGRTVLASVTVTF